jgi:hypothetical protein
MEGHVINSANCQNTTRTTGTGLAVNWIVPPPDDVPPAGVPARPKPAPAAPSAGVLVPA